MARLPKEEYLMAVLSLISNASPGSLRKDWPAVHAVQRHAMSKSCQWDIVIVSGQTRAACS